MFLRRRKWLKKKKKKKKEKLVREIRAFIRNFYAKLSVLVKVCLVERALERVCSGRTAERELKVHGDDFSK